MPFSINPSFTTQSYHAPYLAISPSRKEVSAEGQVILVTGGGKGIGKAIAAAFATAQASRLVLIGRTGSSLAETKQCLQQQYPSLCVDTYILDVANYEQLAEGFRQIQKEVGSVDILVNNAGYLPDFSDIADADPVEWWKGFEVNLVGYFNVLKSYLQFLSPHSRPGRNTQNGKVINVNSAAGHLRYNGMSSYSGAKNAALWLTDSLCEEYTELFAVSMHPGVCATDMNAKNAGVPEEDIDLPAYLSVWLASAEAEFLRGRMIWSTWDIEELKSRKQEIITGDLLKMTLRGYPISRGLGYSTESN